MILNAIGLINIEGDDEESPSHELAMMMDAPKQTLPTSKSMSSFLPSSTLGGGSDHDDLHAKYDNDDEEEEEDEDHGFFLDLSHMDHDQATIAQEQEEEVNSVTSSSKRTSYPRRSSLKTSITEEIPICCKRSSWNKLPVPDLEDVKMKRVESLNSFFHLEQLAAGAEAGATPPPRPRRRIKKSGSRVSFSEITVREYGQTIGDNPSVSKGTPITLDWDYEQSDPQDLDTYEGNVKRRGRRRRTTGELLMNSYQRENLLIYKMGHTPQEVQQAQKETAKVKSQREVTKFIHTKTPVVVRIPMLALAEMKESAIRKCKKTVIKSF